jgi:ATP-dependent DNA ligase
MQFFYPPQPTRIWPNASLFKRIDNDPNYIGEIKLNGWRLEIHKVDNKLLLYNRHGTIIDINSDIFLPKFSHIPNNSILDGELVHFRTKNIKNIIVLWDVMFWDGKDVRNVTWKDRQPFLDVFAAKPNQLTSKNEGQVYHLNVQKQNLVKFYKTVIARNDPLEEGIVIKNVNSQYEYSLKRTFDTANWFKIKKISDSSLVKK